MSAAGAARKQTKRAAGRAALRCVGRTAQRVALAPFESSADGAVGGRIQGSRTPGGTSRAQLLSRCGGGAEQASCTTERAAAARTIPPRAGGVGRSCCPGLPTGQPLRRQLAEATRVGAAVRRSTAGAGVLSLGFVPPCARLNIPKLRTPRGACFVCSFKPQGVSPCRSSARGHAAFDRVRHLSLRCELADFRFAYFG